MSSSELNPAAGQPIRSSSPSGSTAGYVALPRRTGSSRAGSLPASWRPAQDCCSTSPTVWTRAINSPAFPAQLQPDRPGHEPRGINYPACNNNPVSAERPCTLIRSASPRKPSEPSAISGARDSTVRALVNVDLGILKTTKIRENMTLQFRGELFNIFNHTNLSLPLSAIFSGIPSATTTLGRVTNAGQNLQPASPSREIQLGLRRYEN